jgi:predicted nucleic acid-binding protein
MSDKIFLDTNIFIYSIDKSQQEKRKRDIAQKIIKESIRNESGVISIQVLQEFFQVSTCKIKIPLSSTEALEFLHYISILETVKPDFALLAEAISLHKKYNFSFWDALILQAAKTADCDIIYSEDLQHDIKIEKMVVKNPFK